jgi:hypothetical protein
MDISEPINLNVKNRAVFVVVRSADFTGAS